MKETITISFLVVSFIAVSCGPYNSRMRNNGYCLNNMHRDLSLTCSCEDLTSLVTLIRALEERDCCSTGPAPGGSINNADDLIMNLVNALIQLTSQALSHNCHCPSPGGNNNPGNGGTGNNNPGNGGNGNNPPNHSGGYSHPDEGLINLDLLNPNKKDNVLDLDVARQHLLGVGLGGGGGSSHGTDGYYKSNGRNAKGNNDEGLINVDLLNPNKKSNVADVDLGKQQLIGVGLGGGGGASSPSTTNTMTGSNSNPSNTNEGLVNVDLLNPNKQNNVADVDLARQTVLGVGLGNHGAGDK